MKDEEWCGDTAHCASERGVRFASLPALAMTVIAWQFSSFKLRAVELDFEPCA